jgi:hypothetical protein
MTPHPDTVICVPCNGSGEEPDGGGDQYKWHPSPSVGPCAAPLACRYCGGSGRVKRKVKE